MVNDAGRVVVQERMEETLAVFGLNEGNAIIKEVLTRMNDGGTVDDWMDMIETVARERHPYLRYAEKPLD